jgi:hypothetical protein
VGLFKTILHCGWLVLPTYYHSIEPPIYKARSLHRPGHNCSNPTISHPHSARILGPPRTCNANDAIASNRSGDLPVDSPLTPKSHISSENSGVLDPALLVQGRDRFGAQPFAAGGAHRDHRRRAVDLVDHAAHHVAALVDFSTAASRLAFSARLMARADFGLADFLTARFFAVDVLPDTHLVLADFVAGLDDRVVGMLEDSNDRHSGMRLSAQARNP